jgi:uncharacterized protein
MRILVLIAIALLLYIIIGNLLRKNKKSPTIATQKMVKCEHCGVHVPEKESIQSGNDFFCSQAHLDDNKNA